MFSYFYIFFFSHGRSVSLSHLYLVLSLSSRFVASCVSWELKSNVRLVHLAFYMEVVMRERAGILLQNERETLRERNQAKIYRVSISSGSLFDTFAISGSVRRSSCMCGASLHTLSSCARSLASRWEKEGKWEWEKGISFSWESFFCDLLAVGDCWRRHFLRQYEVKV